MSDLIQMMTFWAGIPYLLSHLRREKFLHVGSSALFAGMTVGSILFSENQIVDLFVHGAYFIFVFYVPFLFEKDVKKVRSSFLGKLDKLKKQRKLSEKSVKSLGNVQSHLSSQLERAQNRVALVQVMTTKLEADEILKTLGNMWKDLPHIQGCLLLRHHPNGNWIGSYSDRIFNTDEWVSYLNRNSTIAHSRRIRKFSALDKKSSFPGQNKESSYVLIPFLWDKDVLAVGCLEYKGKSLEDSFDDLNIERKLVSIGLRRAYLYDLMKERSRHDALTGLYLRRSLMERLSEGIRRAERYHSRLFFALMDIDRFKHINDHWGHLTGDKVLKHVADSMEKISHPGITIGRFGGDEFAFVFETESIEEVVRWFEKLRSQITQSVITEENEEIRYTVSVGICSYLPEKPSHQDLISWADKALYRAKKSGRNQIVARVDQKSVIRK